MMEELIFHNVLSEPFDLYGLDYAAAEGIFRRLPDEIAAAISPEVRKLARATAGGRVRFCTDSNVIAIRARMPVVCAKPEMSLYATAGFDLFLDDPETGESRFWKRFGIPATTEGGYESKITFPSKKLRFVTVCFPGFSEVSELLIGGTSDATLGHGMKYREVLPLVFYGSSITHGYGSSRPGNSYENMVSCALRMDYRNLGFSGSAHAEAAIADYLSRMKMSVFICDYDHNSPTAEALRKTHLPLYRKIREAQPDLPILLVTRPDMDGDRYENVIDRRDVVLETYRIARGEGDKHVYFLDGEGFFRGHDESVCTVDGIHPSDFGYRLMADAIIDALRRIRFLEVVL